MKKTTLTFLEMQESFELLKQNEQSQTKGGTTNTQVEWIEDENGDLYYRTGPDDSWHPYSITLNTVTITPNGGTSNNFSIYGYGLGTSGIGSSGGNGESGTGGSGGNSSVTYPLQSSLFYNSSNNTFNLALTTLADYWGDHYLQQAFSALGNATGQSSISNFINDVSFSKSSLVRAGINNLFIKALEQNLGASIIPHASGPTTLKVANHGDDLSTLGMYVQTLHNNLYQELQLKGVLSIDGNTGDVINIDLQKYAEYQNSQEFQNFINRNARYQAVE